MVRHIRFIFVVILLSSFTLSCVKEEYEEIMPNEDGSITVICGSNYPVTKTTLNGLTTNWVANTDKVGIFSPEASITAGGTAGVVNIPLTAQSSGERAQFSGSIFWSTGEHNFYSYYPYKEGTFSHTAVPVSLLKDQIQSAGNNLDHLGSHDFLVAKPYTAKYPGTSGNGASVSLRYNHLFAILEFRIIRSSGTGTITKVRLKGSIPLAFEGGNINLTQETPAMGAPYAIDNMTNTSKEIIVSLETPIDPTNDYETTTRVYMVVFPGTHINDLKIGFESGGIFKEVAKSNITFQRGKKYIIKVDADLAEIPIIDGLDLEPVTIDGLTWAPVNAGYDAAHRYGLYYQWHRKYGQGANTTETPLMEIAQGPVLVDFGNLEENRYTFYKNGSTPYDWCLVQQEFWNLAQKYNPCPDGWRLPTASELSALIASGSGSTWVDAGMLGVDELPGRWFGRNHDDPNTRADSCIFLPAAGTLSYATGNIDSRNGFGQYTSSNSLGGNTRLMLFSKASSPSVSTQPSARGFSVRCVKKTTQLLPVIITEEPFEIFHNTAKASAIIEEGGSTPITEKGIVYATTVKPTTSKSKVIAGSGFDNFTVSLTGLATNTIYYLRSYAINGSGTSYGTEYQFRTTPDWGGLQAVTINGVTWAPANAGYDATHLNGLLYQWNRKYGQGYSVDETPLFGYITTATTVSTVNSTTNMDKFYKISSTQNDCITPQSVSWSQSSYNPCPIGWIVPSADDFNKLIESGSTWVASGINSLPGRWFGGNHSTDRVGSIFLPASGYRDVTSGTAVLRNNSGFYWTTSTSQSPGFYVSSYLNFSSSLINISEQFRGMGYSVRCIKQ